MTKYELDEAWNLHVLSKQYDIFTFSQNTRDRAFKAFLQWKDLQGKILMALWRKSCEIAYNWEHRETVGAGAGCLSEEVLCEQLGQPLTVLIGPLLELGNAGLIDRIFNKSFEGRVDHPHFGKGDYEYSLLFGTSLWVEDCVPKCRDE